MVAVVGAAAIPVMFVLLRTFSLSVVTYAILALLLGCGLLVAGQILRRQFETVRSTHSSNRFRGLPVKVTKR